MSGPADAVESRWVRRRPCFSVETRSCDRVIEAAQKPSLCYLAVDLVGAEASLFCMFRASIVIKVSVVS